MKTLVRAAVATAFLCANIGLSASAQEVTSPGQLTHARNLVALETTTGYQLTGELESTNTCMNTRFTRTYAPNVLAAQEYRRPGTQPICGFIVTWKKTKITVVEKHVPQYIDVREAGGSTLKVRVNIPFVPIPGPTEETR